MSQCPICWDKKCDIQLTRCGHFYHEECIKKWLEFHNSCPYCRNFVYNNFRVMYKGKYYNLKILEDRIILLLNNNIVKTYYLKNIKRIYFEKINTTGYTFLTIKYKKNWRIMRKVLYSNKSIHIYEALVYLMESK